MKLVARFASPAEFTATYDTEISKGGLLVRGASAEGAAAGAECTLEVDVTGGSSAEVAARIAAVVPGVGVAVMFDAAGLGGLAEAKQSHNLFDRLKAMTVNEKMQLALSGSRDERLALMRDNNKTVHVFVLKNPRLGLDEVQSAAKNANLSPDALKLIAEHREWSMNPQICTSLVRNPKTPLPLALKLLDRMPPGDLRVLAKGGAREQLVHAARKKTAGG